MIEIPLQGKLPHEDVAPQIRGSPPRFRDDDFSYEPSSTTGDEEYRFIRVSKKPKQ